MGSADEPVAKFLDAIRESDLDLLKDAALVIGENLVAPHCSPAP